MFKNILGEMVLEIDSRLGSVTHRDEEPKISQADFFHAIKAYKLSEALESLAIISKKLFNQEYPKEYHSMGRGGVRHPSGIAITQFSVEYLSSAFILSGSNNWKSQSIKNKDNLLGLFNIYHSSLIQKIDRSNFSMISLLVPMYFQQFVSQADPKDVFTRQWYLFHKINPRLTGLAFENLDEIFFKKVGLTTLEYTKLSLVIFGYVITHPRFNVGVLAGGTNPGLDDILDDKKMTTFLNFIGSDYKDFRILDEELNKELDPVYTKTRFNPLWIKPVIKMGENDYLVPSITAFITSNFKRLFWWFDTYFRKESRVRAEMFRSYFGTLFEEYVGDVLKDIYGNEKVSPGIKFGTKKNEGVFFDWIIKTDSKIYLFEAKAYQFPLEVLQKGDIDKIRKEIVNKIVYTIIQMYNRIQDIGVFDELLHLRNKNIVPVAVFYDIPFVSTHIYKENVLPALTDLEIKYPGIKDFKYYLIGIEELENYYYVSEKEDIDIILEKVLNNPQTGFNAEVAEINKTDPTNKKNLLSRAFDEYCSGILQIPDDEVI